MNESNLSFSRFNAECLAPLIQQMFQDKINPFGVVHELQFFMGDLRKPFISDQNNRKEIMLLMPQFLDELDLPEKYTGFIYLVIENSGGLLHKLGASSFISKTKLSELELEELSALVQTPKISLRQKDFATALRYEFLEPGF
jgi:hypothetical protein